jgi:hypothetical protein
MIINGKNCFEIKEKIYDCLKDNNLGFDPNILKFSSKSKIDIIENYRLNQKIADRCNVKELAICLSEKYNLRELNDKKMYSHFNTQYLNIMNKIGNDNINANALLKNNDSIK